MGQERNTRGKSTEGLRGNGLSLFLLSFSLFFLLSDPFPQAQAGETPKQNELLAIGDAAVVKGNTALAKKAAITQGLMKGDAMSATVEFQGDRDAFINRVLTHPKRPFPLRLEQTEHEAVVFRLE